MNSAEVVQFVELEIASRYRTIDDTVRGDWVRAVWKAGEIETAREIIRDIVDDPEATLNVKTFYRRLKDRKTTKVEHVERPTYDPYILCLEAPDDHPAWQGRKWYVTGGPEQSELKCFERSNASNKQYVAEWSNRAAKAYEAVHGGQWCGAVLEPGTQDDLSSSAQARIQAEQIILDGPDTPGRRWLLRHRGMAIVPEVKTAPAPIRTVATRDMIDRLRDLPPRPEPAQPLQATPAWFDEESAKLAAEEAEERAAMQQEGSRT